MNQEIIRSGPGKPEFLNYRTGYAVREMAALLHSELQQAEKIRLEKGIKNQEYWAHMLATAVSVPLILTPSVVTGEALLLILDILNPVYRGADWANRKLENLTDKLVLLLSTQPRT